MPPLPLPSPGRTVEADSLEGLERLTPLIVDLDKKLSGKRSAAAPPCACKRDLEGDMLL